MQRDFTATAYIIEQEKVLLLFHPKMQKWFPPGGHLEPNETPAECAIRETKEETGLEIEILREEHIWTEQHNAVSIPRPWMCLLENIPEHKGRAAHQHIDFIYATKIVGGEITPFHQELQPIRWFTQTQVLALGPDREIFVETRDTIGKLFEWHKELFGTEIAHTRSS